MQLPDTFIIRPVKKEDKEFIISMAPRLLEFGPPLWRNPEEMTATDIFVLSEAIEHPNTGTAIFVACNDEGKYLGFIHVTCARDYYMRTNHGHIADLVVAPEGEGKGVGHALMGKAEEWTRDQGYKFLSLSVFRNNTRAMNLYKKFGYNEDTIKFIKKLD